MMVKEMVAWAAGFGAVFLAVFGYWSGHIVHAAGWVALAVLLIAWSEVRLQGVSLGDEVRSSGGEL